MKHRMIDVETLSTRQSAVILSIGFCDFDSEEPVFSGESQFYLLDVDDQLRHGRTVDFSTIKWWNSQSEAARREVFLEGPRSKLVPVLMTLAASCKNFDCVWSHGSNFDLAILENAAESYGINLNLFKRVRDTRTLAHAVSLLDRKLPAENRIKRVSSDLAHSAKEDAIAQAKWVHTMLRRLYDYGA